MKIPAMKLGDKEKTGSVFLKDKTGGIAIILEYNLDELLKKLSKEGK